MLQHLSSEVSCFHTGVTTLVKFRLVVVDVYDVDLDLCCGVGKHSVDVFFGLSSLGFKKYSWAFHNHYIFRGYSCEVTYFIVHKWQMCKKMTKTQIRTSTATITQFNLHMLALAFS